MARAGNAASGTGDSPEPSGGVETTHEYLIRRRVDYHVHDGEQGPAWLELGTVQASSAKGALAAYGREHGEELAALEGEVILEAVSTRFRRVMRANPVRQLEIHWGAA